MSELELTLGEVAAAVEDAERAVTYADRSGSQWDHMRFTTKLASVLHQVGRDGDALNRFREAEAIIAKEAPQTPLLYMPQGFQYCDLLLTVRLPKESVFK